MRRRRDGSGAARGAAARAGAERGFTMVELLAYLAILVAVTGTLVGAEVGARRMNRTEGTLLEALGQADRAFALLSEDCDRATGVEARTVKGRAELELLGPGGVKWIAKDGELLRGKGLVASFAEEVRFERPDAARHPRLLRVSLTFRRRLSKDDVFERTYERSFLIRNLDGDGRGGL
jgi:type II secretory pathway pseudopilin PulG